MGKSCRVTMNAEQSFPAWSPLVTYRRDNSATLTSDNSQASSQGGKFPCLHALCRTCHQISSDVVALHALVSSRMCDTLV